VEQAQERDVYPFIGRLFIDDVTPKKIIDIVKRIEERGAVESARRVHTQIRRIYEYAIAHQRATRNPASEINPSMIFQAPKKQHYDTITKPEGIGRLLLRLEAHEETAPIVSLALRFLALTAVRPGNIYQARREDFDMEAKLWRIPAEQSKTKEELLIPLSRQAIEIIEKVRLYTGETRLIFPSPAHISDPMNPNTLARTLTRMGYTKGAEENIVPHGFRSMFTTIANESGKDFLAIEAQQGHKIGNQVSQAYNRATYINQRRELMQWWADTLDEYKTKVKKKARKEGTAPEADPRQSNAADPQQDQGTPTPKAG
jgi:integrase